MHPNDPYQQPQVPSDYLDQIAAPSSVKTVNPLILWGLIGGLLIAVVAVVLGVSSMNSGPSASSLTSVAARLSNLKAVTDDAQGKIQNSDLRTLNSSLTLSLANTNRDLTEPLKAQEINLKNKKNETVIATTKDLEELRGRLEDARLNAVYDRTYAREVLYELRTLRSDMEVLYKKTRSDELKSILSTADSNFLPVVEGLSNFNET